MLDYEDMAKHPRGSIWWDVYWIQGVNVGFEWDYEDGWLTFNFLIFKVVLCYK